MAWVSIYENGVINSNYFGNTFTETIISGGWTALNTYFGSNSIVFSGTSENTFSARQAEYNFTGIHNCSNATKIRFSGTLTATLGTSGNTYLWFGAIAPGTATVIVKEDATSQTKSFEKEFDISNLSQLLIYYQCANFASSEIHLEKIEIDIPLTTFASGGGATHIAKVTGQLKDLSSNLSDILIISGGGGGGLLVGETDYSGKEAGGISGSGDNSADQSAGNAFGQGESGTDVSGGGSGLYGGYKGTSSKSGGAGSGYIGNSLLSNKKMIGYNVPTSSAENTKTESVNVYSATNEENKPKAGNGFARVKLIRESIPFTIFDSETQYKHPSFTDDSDKYVEGGDGGSFSWRYRTKSNNELYFGNSSYWGGNYGFKWKQPLKKGTATRLYMECECDATGGYSYHTVELYVAKNLQFGSYYTSEAWKTMNIINYANQSNYAGEVPWSYMHRTLVEIPLDNIGNNDIFYVGFHKCDCGCYITKIYFNGEPIFV